MKLSEFKQHLNSADSVLFVQQDGTIVPKHFHITEMGLVSKHFVDCGGTVRKEKLITFQLWVSTDYQHRLEPNKLLDIISLSEKLFEMEDLDIEVEYQTETVGRYGLNFSDKAFLLTAKHTDCLAKDNCGVQPAKQKLVMAEIGKQTSCCTPGGGCC